MTASLLSFARGYKKIGWCPIALPAKGKYPHEKWKEFQTRKPTDDELTAWFGNGERNIGIVTGDISGLLVLDVDDESALDGLAVPPTPCVKSGREDGAHYYFRQAEGMESRNAVQINGRELDVRGNGGLVVAPPSVHSSGRVYKWAISPSETELADPPDWLIKALAKTTRKPADPIPEKITEGQRNSNLASLAGSMRCRGIGQVVIEAALLETNRLQCDPPLGDDEVRAIAASVSKYEPTETATTNKIASSADWNRTDVGSSERYAAEHDAYLRYCHPFRRWFLFDGSRWREDDSGEVTRLAVKTVRKMYAEAAKTEDERKRRELARWALASEQEKRLRAMISLAQSQLPIQPEELDRDPWLFNCTNKTLCLKDELEVKGPRPEDFITKQAAVEYDPDATCPRFMTFLERVLPDPETRVYVQKESGRALTGETREQVLNIECGPGANGKSTKNDTVIGMLGDYAMTTPVETLLVKRYDSIPNDLARLRGARLVVASEPGHGRKLNESLVKDLTGGDAIDARFMRGEWFTFKPTFNVWLVTNHKPVIRGTDHAIWRRIRLVPFTVIIPDHEQDKELPDKLREEWPGILNWAIEGCLLWQKEGLGFPKTIKQATLEYRTEEDVLSLFLEEHTKEEKFAIVGATELYSTYKKWAEDAGEKPLSQTGFGRLITDRGFKKGRSSIGRTEYEGIRLV